VNTRTAICKDCGDVIAQVFEKALDGETAVVWTASIGGWICEATGDEHEPEGLDSTYQRDLDFATEGMSPSELLVDAVFNDLVSEMENHGHSRVRVERALRAWIEEDTYEEADPDLMDPAEALTYAILALNTAEAPGATSAEDYQYLEDNAGRALDMLVRLRDFVIASGEDLPSWITAKDDTV